MDEPLCQIGSQRLAQQRLPERSTANDMAGKMGERRQWRIGGGFRLCEHQGDGMAAGLRPAQGGKQMSVERGVRPDVDNGRAEWQSRVFPIQYRLHRRRLDRLQTAQAIQNRRELTCAGGGGQPEQSSRLGESDGGRA